MKTCPQCEKPYPDTEKFCSIDGSELVAAGAQRPKETTVMAEAAEAGIDCPICGGHAQPGEVFCSFCGARLITDEAPAAPPLPYPPPRGEIPTRRVTSAESFASEPAPEVPAGGRGPIGKIGYVLAALVALALGAWLALHLSQGQQPPTAEASPAASPSPAAAAGPFVALANTPALQVTGDSASAPERNQGTARKMFEDNKSPLLDSYMHVLASNAAASDGMVVALTIAPTGDVTAASVKTSTSPDPGLDADVVNKMMTWKFAPFAGSAVEADYPIIFAHDGAEQAKVESDLSTKLAGLGPGATPEYAYAPAATPNAAPSAAAASTTPGALEAIAPSGKTAEAKPRKRHVTPTPPPKPPLLTRVMDAVRTDRRLSRVNAYTNGGGVVTIYGKVFNKDTKLIAERTVRGVDGVTNVIDNLNTDEADWAIREQQINASLQGAGLTKVTAKVIAGDCYLTGEVETQAQKDHAVTVAQGAAPVTVRTNLIRVVPGNMFGF